jgi:hypothetical protein
MTPAPYPSRQSAFRADGRRPNSDVDLGWPRSGDRVPAVHDAGSARTMSERWRCMAPRICSPRSGCRPTRQGERPRRPAGVGDDVPDRGRAAAALGARGVAAALLWRDRTGPDQLVEVDARRADGRWIHLNGAFPRLPLTRSGRRSRRWVACRSTRSPTGPSCRPRRRGPRSRRSRPTDHSASRHRGLVLGRHRHRAHPLRSPRGQSGRR